MTDLHIASNTIQPISEDFSSDGTLDDYARVDHQHPLSASLREAIFGLTNPSRYNRNLVDNGAMNICQRATSLAGIATDGGQKSVDRWAIRNNAQGIFTCSQAVDAPAGTGLVNSLKLLCTTADAAPAAADYLFIQFAIEGQFLQHLLWGTSAAKPLTVSFWIKSTPTATFICELYKNEGTIRNITTIYTNTTAGWEYHTVTFPGDTSQTITNDSTARLYLIFWLGSGTDYRSGVAQPSWGNIVNANRNSGGILNLASAINNSFQITGVQLEIGTKASAFEFKRFDDELFRCQRYYEKSYDYATAPGANTNIGQASCTAFDGTALTRVRVNNADFLVQKRAVPAILIWSIDGTATNISLYNNPATKLVLNNNTQPSQRHVEDAYFVLTAGAAAVGTLYFFNWTASADI